MVVDYVEMAEDVPAIAWCRAAGERSVAFLHALLPCVVEIFTTMEVFCTVLNDGGSALHALKKKDYGSMRSGL